MSYQIVEARWYGYKVINANGNTVCVNYYNRPDLFDSVHFDLYDEAKAFCEEMELQENKTIEKYKKYE